MLGDDGLCKAAYASRMAQELNPLTPSPWELIATLVGAGIVSALAIVLLVVALVRLTSPRGHSEPPNAEH